MCGPATLLSRAIFSGPAVTDVMPGVGSESTMHHAGPPGGLRMKRVTRAIPLTLIVALLAATGCGDVGAVFLEAFQEAGKEAVQTATSQFVEDATLKIVVGLQQLATEQALDELPAALGNN